MGIGGHDHKAAVTRIKRNLLHPVGVNNLSFPH